MQYAKTVNGLLLAGLMSVTGAASAATTTINFDGMVDPAYGGHANIAAACSNGSACYQESGFLFGVVSDATATNHIHSEINDFDGTNFLYGLAYHNDSSGVYMRRADGGAFKLTSMDFSAPFGFASGNVRTGFWEILGFAEAVNPNLSSGDGTNYGSSRVAYQTVNNNSGDSFNGTLSLNSDFNDADGIKGLWIHFNGAPSTALATGGLPFKVKIDNMVVSDVAAVPVPAAVWLFGSGLVGLVSLGRKKSALVA